jgi:hypothetical protein
MPTPVPGNGAPVWPPPGIITGGIGMGGIGIGDNGGGATPVPPPTGAGADVPER